MAQDDREKTRQVIRFPSNPDLPEQCCEVFQWKYNYAGPWWRRLYFRYVYLPFARFSYHVVKVIPFERIDPDGSLSWKEEQGVWLDCEQAQQEASKYPFGGWRIVRLNGAEAYESLQGRSHFPNSTQWQDYERSATSEHHEVSKGLQHALAESRRVVEQFRAMNRA